MLVGFGLFRELRPIFECLEVYPQAIAVSLGARKIHKAKPEGLRAQLKALNERTGWQLSERDLAGLAFGSAHDKLDACLSAWVASLPEAERIPYGEPPNDVIWIPAGR